MVDPISVSIISKSLALPGNCSGAEAAITTASQIAGRIAKTALTETTTAVAAEKLRPTSKRNQKNFKTQQQDHSEALDTDWEFSGAKSPNSQQVLRRLEQPSYAWSKIARSRERLSQIDRDFSNNGLQLNLAA